GGRRAAAPSRHLPRHRRAAAEDRPRPVRADAPRTARAASRQPHAAIPAARHDAATRARQHGRRRRFRRLRMPSMAARASQPGHDCPRCPRLVASRKEWRAREPSWFNAPVPAFGPVDARLLIVGLAPGLRGANRTGRPFTGDYAGDLLYATLKDFGFARGTYEARPDDGLTLVDCRISNVVRCVPPENKPAGDEISTCRPFLVATIAEMPRLKAIVALGRIAHDTVLAALG